MVELQNGDVLSGLRDVRKGDVFRTLGAGGAGPWVQAKGSPFSRPHPKWPRIAVWNVIAGPAPL